MKTLDANKLYEMDRLSHFTFCMYVLLAVERGHEVVTWNEQDKAFFSVGDEGEERPLLLIDDEVIRSQALETLTRAVETLTSFEGTTTNTGRFLLLIGGRKINVDVEAMATNSPRTITLRMYGAKEARERARAILHELMGEREKHGPMILSYDGERILGHGTMRLKYRIAEIMQWVFVLVWYAFWVALTCVLFALTPLPSTSGIPGWISCVALGLLLAVALAPYVFARDEPH